MQTIFKIGFSHSVLPFKKKDCNAQCFNSLCMHNNLKRIHIFYALSHTQFTMLKCSEIVVFIRAYECCSYILTMIGSKQGWIPRKKSFIQYCRIKESFPREQLYSEEIQLLRKLNKLCLMLMVNI